MTGRRVALVGAGRFAHFIAEATVGLPGLEISAVADADRARAEELAGRIGARPLDDWRAVLDDAEVGHVIVATPPSTHADIVRAALLAGRHVLSEKPLGMSAAEARELAALADRRGRALVVDHVLRYNPLLRAVLALGEGLLGPVQRFCFENDASDEDLFPDHWFWDVSASGGIFVEHGVHFFDAAAMLLQRPATAVQAMSARRSPDGPVDLVSATVAHGGDVLATHTHGFTHAHRCERQLMRLDYGTAEARIEGWIPVVGVVDAWTDDAGVSVAEKLADDPPEGVAVRLDVVRDAASPRARGRGGELHIPHHVRAHLDLGGHEAKQRVYAASVRAAVADLLHCAATGDRPVSNGHTAAAAVAVAEAATLAAISGRSLTLDEGALP